MTHFFFKNYDHKSMINLLCYMTEYPHTLTSTQKLTRLYRYNLYHLDAYSEEKENGPLEKIDVILWNIIATSESLEKSSIQL